MNTFTRLSNTSSATLPIRIVCLCSIALLEWGCATALHKRQYAAPQQEELVRAVFAKQAASTSVNLQTRTTSWLGGDRVRATVLMLVERTGSLRFEAEVSLKGTVAALTTHKGLFQLLDLERNEFHQGPACPQNVARLVRIPLAPKSIAAILLGDAPVDGTAQLVAAEWDADVGAERLIFQMPQDGSAGTASEAQGARSGSRIRVLMKRHKQAWVIVGVQGQSSGGPSRDRWWRVQFEDFASAEGVLMPGTIRFAEAGASFDDGVEIKIKDRRLNADMPESSFTLTPPPDMQVQYLGCDDSNLVE